MRQVLFRIPLDQPWTLGPLGEVAGFGFGIVLLAWVLFGLWWVYRHRRELRADADTLVPVGVWLVVAVLIVLTPRLAQRDSRRAIALHTQAIENLGTGPRAAVHYDQRGLAHLAQREYGLAIDDFRRATEADPQLESAYQHLAWVLATLPDSQYRDGPQAVQLAERAAELGGAPTATEYDILAAALAEIGRYDVAVEQAQQAARLALDARDPQDRNRLSDIRRRLWSYTMKSPHYETPPGKSLPVYGYGFMLFLGFLFGGWDAQRRAARVGIRAQSVWDFVMWMLFAGVAGARLFYVVQYQDKVFAGTRTLGEKLFAIVNLPDGGLVLLGGILLAVAVAYLFCGIHKISRPLMGDVVMPSLVLGIAFGRLGCLMNGCCWGDACTLPWAIRFPVGSVPDDAMVHAGYTAADNPVVLLLHPTQIYSAISAFILYLFLATLFWYRRRDGVVLAATMILYAIGRFLLEFVRSDEAHIVMTFRKFLFWGNPVATVPTPFTISQWISIGLFIAGGIYLLYLWRQPRAVTEPDSAPHVPDPGLQGMART